VPYPRLFPVLLLLLICTAPTFATDRYYVGPDNGLWSSPNNWSLTDGGPGGAGPPQSNSSDRGVLLGTIPKTLVYDGTYTESARFGRLDVQGMTFSQSASNLYAHDGSVFAAAGQTASWDQSGGFTEFVATGGFNIGAAPGGTTTATISGTATLFFFNASISNATLDQTGGTFGGDDYLQINSSVYNLSAGRGGSDAVGVGPGGTINQSGGTFETFSSIALSGTNASASTYNLKGGTSTHNTVYVGTSGTGTFNQSGGTLTASSLNLYLGVSATDQGFYNLSGGSLHSTNLRVGYFGTGIFNQTGGGNDSSVTIASGSGSHGTYTLSKGDLLGTLTNNDTFVQTGGLVNTFYIQNNASLAIYPGTQTLTHQFTQAASGRLSLQLDDPDNADYPHMQIAPQPNYFAILNGNLTITLRNDYAPTLGDTFTLITSPTLSGTFSSYTLPPLSSGLTWLPTYTPTTFSLSVAIPEPTLSLLLLLPLLAPRRQLGSRLREVQVLP
jgi:hypothetical protein